MNTAHKTISILLVGIAASCSPAVSNPDGTTPNATSAPPSATAITPVASAMVSPPETPVATGPEVILHGKNLAIKSALVHSYGGQERRITLSTAPLTCDDVKARGRGTFPNEQTITLGIVPPLRGAKGQSNVTFSFPKLDRFPMTRAIVSETIKPLPASVGGQVKTLLELDHTEPDDEGGAKQSLRIKGDFDLKDCGVFPASEKGVADAQTKLKVEVNGEEIAIQGAILVPFEKDYRLMLTSGANGCDRDSFSDVSLEIRLSPGAVSPKGFILLGSRIVGSSQNDLEKSLKGITMKVPKAMGAAGQKASLSLNGAITVPDSDKEIAIKLAGTVSALVCAN